MNETRKKTVLVVDDEEALRESVVFDFKRQGFSVLAAANGTEAIALLDAHPVDLVVSDVRMPGGDGLTMLDLIRRRHPRLPVVILLTGFADVSDEECLRRGAHRVFAKPFERRELMACARAALAQEAL